MAASKGYRLQLRAGLWELVSLEEPSPIEVDGRKRELSVQPVARGLTLAEIAAWLEGERAWAPPGFDLW